MKKFYLLAILLLATACGNTFDGVGADMEKMGKKIQGKEEPERQYGY